MMSLLLVLIFIMAGLSLVSYVYCWLDISTGRPHIISLRQILAIMDRNQINRLFGTPDPGYYYTLSPQQLGALVRRRRWYYYRECAADITCLLGSWHYLTGFNENPAVFYWFVLLAGLCQGINLTYSVWLIGKWRSQLREEIENTDD